MSILRVAHIGDHHIRPERRGDRQRSIAAITEGARSAKVNLIVQAGDWYDRTSTPEDRQEGYDALLELASVAPVVMVRGNHDKQQDIAPLRLLKSVHPIYATETIELHAAGGVLIGCLPHIEKGHAVAALPASLSSEEQDRSIAGLIRAALAFFRLELARHQGPTMLLSHCHVSGSVYSSGETARDHGIVLSVADLLSAGADYVALGHLHNPQEFDGGRIRYAGSTTRNDWGEEDEEKSWTLVEFDGKQVRREIVPLPVRPMRTFEATFDPEIGWSDNFEQVPAEAEIRVRITVPGDCNAELAQMEAQARDRYPGAKIDPHVRANPRVRAPEISTAKTPEEKWLAWVNTTEVGLSDRVTAGCLAKIDQAKRTVAL